MQFALVENNRTSPAAGIKGTCPACGGAMVARCGNQRVHHWAHLGKKPCDLWSEPETPWHRGWKNLFPENWQEVILHDRNGEKHISDVRTGHGLTIEFQHSHLKPEERSARENFYGNMLWVVDGSRLIRDLPRFADAFGSFRMLKKGWYVAPLPEEAFPRSWVDSSVPVLFDFGEAIGSSDEHATLRGPLWCVLPRLATGQAVLIALSRADFVRMAHGTAQPIQFREILDNVANLLAEERRSARNAVFDAAILTRQRWRSRGRRARF